MQALLTAANTSLPNLEPNCATAKRSRDGCCDNSLTFSQKQLLVNFY